MPQTGGSVVAGEAPTNKAGGGEAPVGNAAQPQSAPSTSLKDLREALDRGDITEEQFNQAVTDALQKEFDAAEKKPQDAGDGGEAVGADAEPDQLGAPPQGVDFSDGADEDTAGALSEDEDLLAGDTDRPNEPLTTPITGAKAKVSPEILKNMDALLAAAQMPDAPDSLRVLIQILDQAING